MNSSKSDLICWIKFSYQTYIISLHFERFFWFELKHEFIMCRINVSNLPKHKHVYRGNCGYAMGYVSNILLFGSSSSSSNACNFFPSKCAYSEREWDTDVFCYCWRIHAKLSHDKWSSHLRIKNSWIDDMLCCYVCMPKCRPNGINVNKRKISDFFMCDAFHLTFICSILSFKCCCLPSGG